MVEVHLSDEEKIEVLLLALGFFFFALILSFCLAATFCPLNRWLLNRSAKKRQRKLQQQQQYYLNYSNNQLATSSNWSSPRFNTSGPHQANRANNHRLYKGPSYIGPPPAYEAALRATRLQSLTGSLYSQDGGIGDSNSTNKPPLDELDFGDYFHQPKECNLDTTTNEDEFNKHQNENELIIKKQPNVMLRIWVKVLEPNELVLRAKGGLNEQNDNGQDTNESNSACSTISRRLSLNRQLSIPQFFGSLVNTLSTTTTSGNVNVGDKTVTNTLEQINVHNAAKNKEEDNKSLTSGDDSSPPPLRNITTTSQTNNNNNNNNNPYLIQSSGILNTISSITSRVLHMNVASFSYVKDETLISTKKHNQMNYQQFFNLNNNKKLLQKEDTNNNNNNNIKGLSKSCQLVISICDIENILKSSLLNEKSCALLSNNSAIYVQCEILLPKSKSARLLGPLLTKALPGNNNNKNEQSNKRHTVNFESVISASAVESRPPGGNGPIISKLPATSGHHHNHNHNHQQQQEASSIVIQDESFSSNKQLSSISTTETIETTSSNYSTNNEQQLTPSTNWRHEPSADGTSIVVFSSVPKEIAHQQQLTASVTNHQNNNNNNNIMPLSDLILFDSVFVSPILNRSTIENGFIRFRIYSQCKYVNETCLAELKLPLKQLLENETNDNLNDNLNYRPPQKQADFILNNLLTNLVTASTGSPLSTLIEQISSEEKEANLNLNLDQSSDIANNNNNSPLFKSLLHFPWTSNSDQPLNNNNNSNKGLKGSSSFNESLYRLTNTKPISQDNNNNYNIEEDRQNSKLVQDTERRIEENYYRSLMVSHWLNYLVAPSYECQLVDEPKGKIILSLSYLPTSNRVIFNAHRATIDDDSYSNGKHMMKNLRLQTSTCYLLRFLMVANGRVIKRKQTPISKKPEWDNQEPITFDLVSISVEQPSFIVALVMRNAAMTTGSLQNLRCGSNSNFNQQKVCNCGLSNHQAPLMKTNNNNNNNKQTAGLDVQSEPESLQHFGSTYRASTIVDGLQNNNGNNNKDYYRQHHHLERDLVIGHLVLSDEIWREMKSQPRKQIVKQFKMY